MIKGGQKPPISYIAIQNYGKRKTVKSKIRRSPEKSCPFTGLPPNTAAPPAIYSQAYLSGAGPMPSRQFFTHFSYPLTS